MRTQIELSNEVAAELAGSQDAVLRALEAHLDCKVYLRGNLLTFDGEETETHAGERVVRELAELIARGHQIGPGTITAVTGALDAHESPARVLEDVVWRHRGLRVAPEDGQPEALRRLGPPEHDHLRRRARRAPARPSWPWRWRRPRSPATRSTGSSSRGPAVEAGERLGFLPGDLMAKVDPYLRPLFDALHDMLDPEKVSQHIERGVIEIAPLAFMRGRTLNDSFVILDEAQNTTPEQMKMFLTRLGFGSRMVVTGDVTQVDLPREQQSGLIVVGDVLDAVEGIEFVRFGGEDVVRHKLVQRIVEAYDVHSQREAAPPRRGPPASALRPQRLSRDDRRRGVRRGPRARGAAGAGGPRAVRAGGRRSGIEQAHVAVEFVDAARIAELNAEHRGKAEPDRRALLPDRRRRGEALAAAPGGATPRELGDIVICPEHTADCARRSSTACCTCSAWTTRPTTARCWRFSDELLRGTASDPQRLRGAGRAPQRRQVDIRQRRRGGEGGDRLRPPADDQARDPRCAPAAATASSSWSTCRACSDRATR